jgi:hypothetical protein
MGKKFQGGGLDLKKRGDKINGYNSNAFSKLLKMRF